MLEHFYSPDYLEHLSKITGSRLETYNVDGLFINFFTKNGEFGDVLNSSPFYGSHGGFFAPNGLEYKNVQIENLKNLVLNLSQQKVLSITIIENPYCLKSEESKNLELIRLLRQVPGFEYQKVDRISSIKFMNDIESDEALFDSYHPKTRNCVRKFLKSNAEILTYEKQSNEFEDALNWIYEEHNKGIRSKGGFPNHSIIFAL